MENTHDFQIVSCSGASNTGLFADDVARQLNNNKEASMICLAKIAVGDQALIKKVKLLLVPKKQMKLWNT